MLAAAREAGEAVIVVGGGTMLAVGDPPRRYDQALSTGALRGIVEYNPADLTIVVRAGTTMEEMQEEMERHEQFLPLDPPLPVQATIGGSLAAGSSGPWRFAYGSARDFVIGMRMALPSGQVAKSGGRVVKNVAGYDLAKLFIGSYGTLGAIVEVALKTYPRLSRVQTLIFQTGTISEALGIARRLRDLGPGLLAAPVVSRSLAARWNIEGPAVIVQVGGTDRAVADLANSITSQGGITVPEREAPILYAAIRDFPAHATAKLSSLPSRILDSLLWDDRELLVYPLVGLSYLYDPNLSTGEVNDLRHKLALQGGSVVLQDASLDLLRQVGAWGEPAPDLALMRKVKDVFDPEGVMSPGRYVGGL